MRLDRNTPDNKMVILSTGIENTGLNFRATRGAISALGETEGDAVSNLEIRRRNEESYLARLKTNFERLNP